MSFRPELFTRLDSQPREFVMERLFMTSRSLKKASEPSRGLGNITVADT